jgi:tRNA-dihydrouridine synthase
MEPSSPDTNTRIYIAPLQGFTDYTFRATFVSTFGTPDAAFSPYLETHKPDHRVFRDVLTERNSTCHLVPQLLGNDVNEMLPILNHLLDLGYNEANWNLGCPYPMVTKKAMGAGLLPYPERIDSILDGLFKNTNCKISVKMRLGITNSDEWKALVPVLNRYPLHEVIIHGRTAAQMYKGEVDTNAFKEMANQIDHPVCYNGNLFTLEQFTSLSVQLPNIKRWMIGRGLLANPLLLNEIRTGQKANNNEIIKALEQLHNQLLYQNSIRLNGPSHILNKMKPYWEYFAPSFVGREKALKKIKKAVTLDTYKVVCNEAFMSNDR